MTNPTPTLQDVEGLIERLQTRAEWYWTRDSERRTVQAVVTALQSLTQQVEEMREALELAANRLDLLTVNAIAAGDPHSIEYGEWVDAARQALSTPSMENGK